MTFSIIVPNASQSPGVFPAQNNTNFTRLKAIIDNDHNFTDSTAANEGVHNQVTLIDRTPPGSLLAGTNGILYSEDVSGASQLRYYNGSDTYNLTPSDDAPLRIAGSMSLGVGGTTTAYADPGFRWAGTGWACYLNESVSNFYNLLRSGGNVANILSSTGSNRPTLGFTGSNLIIANGAASTKTVVWSLIINRIA